ncbi:hypothetical protein N7491_008888 [Penicillium cf. griseofulvum]|uniref:Uncharacterized protein n=1 Tax=Penicillium cf. griseofulvum TaxID=2972120 RepID=A0A9W9JUG5_9EURO|nr:hypothetical protein N7472_005515 [Penicillium cf. griseofulvum]KAJ5423672.1 hypothetical protein N7491_008888 [Penicillium cf. griseofulvum]KAJ5431075.1 hypothetical protein N7445_008807 [Penicillium cf. griseofulvum]
MEQLVVQKLEMKSRILAWDPDEYTLVQIDIAKKKETCEESEKPHIEVDEVEGVAEFASVIDRMRRDEILLLFNLSDI